MTQEAIQETAAGDIQDEMATVARAARDALTDSMVERLTTAGANALEVVDRLNDDDTREAILTMIDKMTDLHRCGALETLFDLVFVLHSARTAATDGIIERLFAFGEHMVNNLANEEVATLAHNAKLALEETVDGTTAEAPREGLFATLSLLRKPESQEALRFMLRFSSNFQKRAVALQRPPGHDT